MKILCIGHAAYDITVPVETFPEENSKNRVNSRVECGGGPASTAAYLLGKWGLETYFMGIVGDDEYGHKIKFELENQNVNTQYLELNREVRTTTSFIIANAFNGSRTVFTYRPQDMKCSDVEIDFKPDIILIDGQEYELSKKMLNQFPDAISIIDAGRNRPEIIELSKMVNYLVCSKTFAEDYVGVKIDFDNLETINVVFNALENDFKNTIIITVEERGCLYKKDGEVRILTSIKRKAIDSTGAGDIFHGAFTYGIAQGYSMEKTLKIANIAGGLSVMRIGGRFSVSTLEEVENVYNEHQ